MDTQTLHFKQLTPILYVSDLAAEVEFYKALGFEVSYEGPEFPGFIALKHGDIEFGLERTEGFSPREAARVLNWQLVAKDLRPVIELAERQGFKVETPHQYWAQNDAWEMAVWTPNGYRLQIEGPHPSKGSAMRADTLLPSIEQVTYIDVPPNTVFETLTSAKGWDGWFTDGTELDARVGSTIILRWKNFGAGHFTTEDGGEIVCLEPDKRFAFKWHPGQQPTTVEFALEQKGAGTLVRLTETGYVFDDKDAEACVSCAVGWGEALTLLKFFLERGVTYGDVPG